MDPLYLICSSLQNKIGYKLLKYMVTLELFDVWRSKASS
jgi:hypothetical protein